MLSLAAVIALFAMMLLDVLRARLLAAAGASLDRRLGPRVLEGLMAQSARLAGAGYLHGLRDVATLRAFFSGQGSDGRSSTRPGCRSFCCSSACSIRSSAPRAFGGAVVMVVLAFLNERLTRGPFERAQTQARQAARFIEVGTRNADVVEALGMAPALSQALDGAERSRAARAPPRQRNRRRLLGLHQVRAPADPARDARDRRAPGALAAVTAGIMIAGTILLGRALAPVETLVGELERPGRGARRLAPAAEPSERAVHGERGDRVACASGHLKVEQLVFRLPQAERPILRGRLLRARGGRGARRSSGPSASGKSTLARLLVGRVEAGAGTVRLDGADVAAWPREQLGPYIGYLPQDVELFTGTVAREHRPPRRARRGGGDPRRAARARPRADPAPAAGLRHRDGRGRRRALARAAAAHGAGARALRRAAPGGARRAEREPRPRRRRRRCCAALADAQGAGRDGRHRRAPALDACAASTSCSSCAKARSKPSGRARR